MSLCLGPVELFGLMKMHNIAARAGDGCFSVLIETGRLNILLDNGCS